jgi:hypothetical protein
MTMFLNTYAIKYVRQSYYSLRKLLGDLGQSPIRLEER